MNPMTGVAGMEGCQLFRRDTLGRRGGSVVLYVRESLHCTALSLGISQ